MAYLLSNKPENLRSPIASKTPETWKAISKYKLNETVKDDQKKNP